MRELKIAKNIYSLVAVLLILSGLVLVIWPQLALNITCKLVGALFIACGIVKLFSYFTKDIFQLAFQFDFGLGIVSMIIGLVLLLKSQSVIEVICILIGIFILIDGALKIQTAIDGKNFGIEKWWMILVIALISAVLGILLIILPFETTGWIMRLIGLNICLEGLLNLWVVQNTVNTIRRKEEWEV
jgi:hypothetical protein